MRLQGKRALVTGGASGIGFAIAKRFVDEGARVVIADVSASQAAEAVKKANGKFGQTIGDVSNMADAERMVREAVAQLGGLGILVNNAGIETTGSVTSCDDSEWDRQIAVNLYGTYRMSRFAVPEIIKAGGGAVINMGSVGGLVAVREYSAYGASKAGIIQLTRSMAADYAENKVRVNCLCPGPVDTPLLRRACDKLGGANPEKIAELYASFTLMKRLGQPEEVASAACFLASDDSSFITGVALPVDGGFVAQ
jgi:NAD(P)-dependent dehydrogenase (short-subunit alcohol dehydrogenase family)